MNTELRKKAKNNFKKDFFKQMINLVFGKTMENVKKKKKKHRGTKLIAVEARWNYFVSEPNYDATKFFTKSLLAIEMRKIQVFMNKPVYLDI